MKNLLTISLVLFSLLQTSTSQAEDISCNSRQNPYICLLCNCYFETRGEPQEGKIAVAKTVLSRKENPDYPDTVCGVVFQPSQFSWTKKSSLISADKPEEINDLNDCREAVHTANGEGPNGLIYFYNPRKVTPAWSRTARSCGRIGDHVFLVPRGKNCPARLGANPRGTPSRNTSPRTRQGQGTSR